MERFSPRYRFADWPNREIPAVAAGVYVIWHGDVLIYCGMSGRSDEVITSASKKEYGLVTRLRSHASGRLSGDQFCVYVANRIVIPSLLHDDLIRFKDGELHLDGLTKRYIRDNCEYQYAVVESSSEAFSLEKQCKNGLVFGVKPFLNPM